MCPDLDFRRPNLVFLLAALLVAMTCAAYHAVGRVPFVFDDSAAVLENPTIRRLWPLRDVLSPPQNATGAIGRPIVNLSLALNYAAGGTSPRGYHVFNVVVHLAGALALFGILRRTFRRPPLATRFGEDATLLGWCAALLWSLHPLQTESVVCVIQRSELIVGCFYLLTLYAFVRSVDSPAPLGWQVLAWFACALGMASKELMVSAPLMLFLYDRTFVAGTFASAWRQRRKFYYALAGAWLVLVWVMVISGQRGGTSGLGLGVTSWEYLLTQCRALVLYLKLSLWPDPLVLDYGIETITRASAVVGRGLFLIGLAAGTAVALWRRPVLGFNGAWFFAILAPSSSFIPLTTQTMAEHRMYLPLAAVIILVVTAIYRSARTPGLALSLILALAGGWLTARRVDDYRDEVTIWQDNVAKWPTNARAHNNLAELFLKQGRTPEAIVHQRASIRLEPHEVNTHYNLGNALMATGDPEGAIACYHEALRLGGGRISANIHHNLGTALEKSGRVPEAVAQYERALQIEPQHPQANNNLAMLLDTPADRPRALEHFARAVHANPQSADIELNFGNALAHGARPAEALAHYRRALALRPDFPAAQIALGMSLADSGQMDAAIAEFQSVLRQRPQEAEAHFQLADVLSKLGRRAEAIAHYEQALEVKPTFEAYNDLAVALRAIGRTPEALPHFRAALKLRPDSAEVHYNFALALQELGQTAEARLHYTEARRRRPDLPALDL
ncbi:MAG TPA: tetratricopeptide repeat protein [Opitutaceae bacterium]|nr:tetratricopeptide repeat protein [Opitutaceae bacterium]